MTFDKTKEQVHTEEEVKEDLKEEETTSATTGPVEDQTHSSEEDTSTNEVEETETTEEESVDSLKERMAKAERDRDNYKTGMLSVKAKQRNLVTPDKEDEVDLNEQVVMEVLGKQSEKTALRNTIDAKHTDYIPELVDDYTYNEIIAFLPRNMDKSDYNSIVKSLKIATRMWKEEKGIKEQPAKVIIPSPKTTQAKESKLSTKKTGRNLVGKTSSGMDKWY